MLLTNVRHTLNMRSQCNDDSNCSWLPYGFLASMAVFVSTGWPGPNLFSALTRNLYFFPGSRSLTTCEFLLLGIVPGTFSQKSVPSSHFSTTYPANETAFTCFRNRRNSTEHAIAAAKVNEKSIQQKPLTWFCLQAPSKNRYLFQKC